MSRTTGNTVLPNAEKTDDATHLCDPCQYDDTKESAVGFCVVCVEYLCQGCCRDHKKSKVTRDHKIIKDNLPEDATVFRLVKEMTSCTEHPDIQVSHKCEDHRVYVCVMCIAGAHRKCDHVTELQKERSGSESDWLKTTGVLEEIKEKSERIVEKRKENMNVLVEEQNDIHRETSSLLQQLQQNLTLLEQDVIIRSENLTHAQLAVMKNDVDICEQLQNQRKVFEKLLNTVKEHFSCTDLDIVTVDIQQKLAVINNVLDEQQQKDDVHLKFKPNKSLFKLKSLGHLTCCQNDLANDTQIAGIEASSDEIIDSQTCVSKKGDKAGKTNGKPPTKDANKARRKKKTKKIFTARSPDDANDCCISGIIIFQDGRLVVIDQVNRKIKVFSSGDFKLIFVHALEAEPVDLCKVGPKTFSLVYKDVKLIERFTIDGKTAKLERSWKTKFCNVAITKDEEFYAVLCKADGSNASQIYIQIRRDNDCKVLLEANIFKTEEDEFENDYFSICTIGTEIIVANKYVGIIIYHRTNFESLEVVRTLNANKDCSIDLRGLYVDKAANLYACSPSFRCVYESSAQDYGSLKKIASDIEKPLAVAVSQKKDRLIVGCHGDNYIHIFNIK
ncbi:uncharacterized protein LOC132737551 [Ruditapes philippinarum]|uniref:uncharacterized protein LOC132737551 n=1 Tax=Ruditapes philippinarum TaxID=129788 RepID=UPI00295B3A74|nr:uncharacterized protein LOC132737551 [Ruditapes philippinarum]